MQTIEILMFLVKQAIGFQIGIMSAQIYFGGKDYEN